MKNVVILPEKTSFDVDKISKIIKEIGGKKGCNACCSGDPIDIVIEEKLERELKPSKNEKIYKYDINTDSVTDVY